MKLERLQSEGVEAAAPGSAVGMHSGTLLAGETGSQIPAYQSYALPLMLLDQGTHPAGKGHHGMGWRGRRGTCQPGSHATGASAAPVSASNREPSRWERHCIASIAKVVQF